MKFSTATILSFLPLLVLSAPVAVSSPEPELSGLEAALSEAFSGTGTLTTRTPATPVSLSSRAVTTTENGLTTDACKPLIFIFARGTNEDGNVGTVVGPGLIADLRSSLGTAKITAQGVDYAANVLGYLLGGDPAGTTEMTRLVNLASTKCPSAKIALGGYSQGAQVVHDTAKALSAAVTAKIVAVVVFGDPDNGQAVGSVPSSKVDSICHDQDIICTGSGGFTTHLTYGDDAASAAAFIVAHAGV